MTLKRKNLAAFTIILGILTLILIVSAFAEKAHGDHLPERNGRGTAGSIITFGVPVGILILLSAVSGFTRRQNRYRNTAGTLSSSDQACCPAMIDQIPLVWPMRLPYCRIPSFI
ncbi:hypothetical protein [Methanoregula sp.]|uniref:hypothetical protein n=1 Tax=Methanoregula sp. TaxID=2052170 RepID=UPI003562DF39